MIYWWGVTTKFYDDHESCEITDTIKKRCGHPGNTFEHTNECDIYVNWFGSKEEAEEDVKRFYA